MQRPAGTKAAPQPMSDDDLHEEYAWPVLHNLVPFADKLLGIAGAMDQRPSPSMIGRCACPSSSVAARPSSQMALTVAHVMNVIFWPRACRPSGTTLGRADGADLYRGGAQSGSRYGTALPAVKALLITFTSRLLEADDRVFGSSRLRGHARAELSAALFGARVPASSSFARGLLASAPAQIVHEFLVPTPPRAPIRGARALLFHFSSTSCP